MFKYYIIMMLTPFPDISVLAELKPSPKYTEDCLIHQAHRQVPSFFSSFHLQLLYSMHPFLFPSLLIFRDSLFADTQNFILVVYLLNESVMVRTSVTPPRYKGQDAPK